MKTNRMRFFIKGIAGAALVGLVTFTGAPAKAATEMIYAVDQYNTLFNFWSDSPAFVLNQYPITGLQLNEEIRGLDYYDGTIYGLGSIHRLYTIDPTTGAATQVGSGQFSPILNGASFGFDNGPTGVRVVSNLGQNLLVNRATAAVTSGPNASYLAGDPFAAFPPRVDALAYDYASSTWYAADTLQNTLATFNPTTGKVSTIGFLGIDASTRNGLDISSLSGIMYMGTPASSSDPQANLYSINMMTGAATLVGQIDVPMANTLIRGLTVVPEPHSVALLGLGTLGMFMARRREWCRWG